ncbi:hypothetical protein [Stakelama tenebrarum]|uniref:DUF4190 domain-containing protein n=1 Tax=Stakelama tenebrarum TaxID=2711215 RepID=A0A6G6Y4V2_9SPHN|nr:hypothetical protein [Sphingosinithalassobacter tenebrarum]QIG79633.1 hypothetical protein G5C33_07405 [Sphingosinithalassobacter tenebrarum]
MRGTILGYDAASNEGVITDSEGKRVSFARSEWKSTGDPMAGRPVDFDMADDKAVCVYALPGAADKLSLNGQDPARQATLFGIIALVCAVLTFFLGPLGIVTVIVAIVFGTKGKNVGRGLADKTGYQLSVVALVLAAIALLIIILALSACASIVGLTKGFGAWL